MKKPLASLPVLSFALLASAPLSAVAGGGFDKSACAFNGHKLFRNIQVVDSFPDVKVQVVDAFPDVKVQKVDAFPDKCGKWKMVTSFPDTKVHFVTSFPDVKVKYVDAFPGVN
jgi:hypothetical protein